MLTKFRNLLSNSLFLRDVGIVSISEAIAGIIALFFTVACARLLGVEQFGLLQALLALYATLSFFLLPLYFAALHFVGVISEEKKLAATGEFLFASGIGCIAIGAALTLFSPVVADQLQSKSLLPVIAIATLLITKSLLMVVYGAIQAQNEYRIFATSRVSESSLCLVSGILLILAQMDVAGALLGYVLSSLALLVYCLRKFQIKIKPCRLELLKSEFSSLKRMFFGLAVVLFLANFPVLFARTSLDAEQSGLLGALYNLRNVILPFSFAISVPFYTRTLSEEDGQSLLFKAFILVCLIGLGFIGCSFMFSQTIITLIYGSQFLRAAPYLSFYGISLWLEMLALLFVFHSIASGLFSYRRLLPAILFTIALLFVCVPENITELVTIQLVGWAALLLGQKKLWQIPLRFAASASSGKQM